MHCHSNSDNGIKQCFSIALNETDDNNGDSDYNELEKYNDSNNSIEVLEESSDNEEESDKKVDWDVALNTREDADEKTVTKSDGSKEKPTGESAEDYIAKSDISNLYEKLREKQLDENTEEKDFKAAIKCNNFN